MVPVHELWTSNYWSLISFDSHMCFMLYGVNTHTHTAEHDQGYAIYHTRNILASVQILCAKAGWQAGCLRFHISSSFHHPKLAINYSVCRICPPPATPILTIFGHSLCLCFIKHQWFMESDHGGGFHSRPTMFAYLFIFLGEGHFPIYNPPRAAILSQFAQVIKFIRNIIPKMRLFSANLS